VKQRGSGRRKKKKKKKKREREEKKGREQNVGVVWFAVGLFGFCLFITMTFHWLF